MSGHSKWSTIKHKKAATDAVRGKLFSKLSRAISVAIKTGGGADPEANSKLRMAIEQARAANMPKANVERVLQQAQSKLEDIEEVIYEGFGPSGIGVMVEVATDNRNRTGQEIKNIIEKGGGSLAGPGSVSFNFILRGLIVVEKQKDLEAQMLAIIDSGVEDVEETEGGVEIYVAPDKLNDARKKLERQGFFVISSELFQKPKNLQEVGDEAGALRAISFLEKLQDHDDVQKVFTNFDIPTEVLEKIKT